MKKVIYKYKIVNGPIELPFAAKILKVGMQRDTPTMWALINPETKTESRNFVVIGTGDEFDDTDMKHVETFFDGPFVWHLFEKVK